MAYDEELAQRVRAALARRKGLSEKRMFGGLCFLLQGNMCCGVLGDELVVRLAKDGSQEALDEPHTRPMDFTGKPMRGFVFVGSQGVVKDADLKAWVRRGADYARTLPAK